MMLGNVFNAVRMTVAYGLAVVNCKFIMLTDAVEEILGQEQGQPAVKDSSSIDVKNLLGNKGAAADGGALAVLEEQVIQYGGGAYSITQTGVIYVAGIGMLFGAGAMFIHAHNAPKREEDKTAMYWRIAAGVLVFAAIPTLVFAQKIGEALFGGL